MNIGVQEVQFGEDLPEMFTPEAEPVLERDVVQVRNPDVVAPSAWHSHPGNAGNGQIDQKQG